jgi:hypothetical protein
MKANLLIVLLLISSLTFAQENKHKDRKKYNDKDLREIVSMISSNFEKLEREYLTKLSYRDYTRAKSILVDSYDLLNSIPLPDEDHDNHQLSMSDSDFNGLIESVKSEGFDSDKIGVISMASDYHYFKAEQVLQLINMFVMSDSKIEVVKITYPKIIDKSNSHRLLSAFTFSSDKDEVKKIITTYPIK